MPSQPNPGDNIPDGEVLWRYLKPEALPLDQPEIPVKYFTDKEMSCDWEHFLPDPKSSQYVYEYGYSIVRIEVNDKIRNVKDPTGNPIPGLDQKVLYEPTPENDAHSVINGSKKLPVQQAIRDSATLIP